MGKIAVEGMRFQAYHGFYPEERLTGHEFGVDVYIRTDFGKAAGEDDLSGTINYETVFRAVQLIMKEPVQLLEHVAQKIIERLKFQFDSILEVTVRVSKYNPPLGGDVQRVYIELERSFDVSCPRCGRVFADYGDENCWCRNASVIMRKQEALKEQFGGCLCPDCLSGFSR